MFGIGMPEMILILAVALIVIGPKKLPDLAKSLGRAFGEFKKATNDLKSSLELDSEYHEVTKTFDSAADDIESSAENPVNDTETSDSIADDIKPSTDDPVDDTETSQTDSTPRKDQVDTQPDAMESEARQPETKRDGIEEIEKKDRG